MLTKHNSVCYIHTYIYYVIFIYIYILYISGGMIVSTLAG